MNGAWKFSADARGACLPTCPIAIGGEKRATNPTETANFAQARSFANYSVVVRSAIQSPTSFNAAGLIVSSICWYSAIDPVLLACSR